MAHLRISIITISLLLPTLNIIGCEEKAQNSSTFRQDLIREFSPDKSFLSSEELSKIKDVPQAFIEQYILINNQYETAVALAINTLTPDRLDTLYDFFSSKSELSKTLDQHVLGIEAACKFVFSQPYPDQSHVKLIIKNIVYTEDFYTFASKVREKFVKHLSAYYQLKASPNRPQT